MSEKKTPPTDVERALAEATGGLDGSEIAIVAMTCRLPGAESADEFWRNLREGRETLTELSDEELRAAGVPEELFRDPRYVRRASVVDGIEDFDAGFFGYTPLEATIMDPQHRLFLECAWEAFELAGYDPSRYPGRIGVFTGAKTNTYLFSVVANRERFPTLDNFQIALGNDLAVMATRVSYKFDLRGPSYALHTACSTSLVAVHLACQSLLLDECSMALAGGAAVNVPQRRGYLYQKGGILSPDGSCRTFDADAAGSNFGNGAGAVLLKRLDDAIRDGDPIHAVIRGSATNNDGAQKASFTAPGVEGQTDVLIEAMACAGVEADEISYVEAHGTATDLGDSIEMLALQNAFRASTERRGFCAIGSAKTNLGHLETAAGIAGLIKTALALEHRELPPSLHFESPNPKIDFESSPFYVVNRRTPWETAEGRRRLAGVSSFGIGSTNAHVILEEPPPVIPGEEAPATQLLTLSARTPTALEALAGRLARHFRENPGLTLADVAYTLQAGRKPFEVRRAVVGTDLESAAAALESPAGAGLEGESRGERRAAFLVPGLGEHYAEMGLGLYRREPVFRDVVDRCCRELEPVLGRDLREILYPRGTDAEERVGGSGGKLDLKRMLGRDAGATETGGELERTIYAQPATFVVELALARLLQSWRVEPQAMIGYSLGEYVCACLSGVLSLSDALKLVAGRARLIEDLPPGGMLAVTLSEADLQPWLERFDLALAATNGATGCVASGPAEAIAELARALDEEGVVHRRLPTAHAFHSPMMEAVSGELTELARTVEARAPEIPYLSNVTGTWIRAEDVADPGYWARHMCRPVRFAEGLGELLSEGPRALVELGPGGSLSSFAKLHPLATDEHPVVAAMRSSYASVSDAEALLEAAGRLWVAGVGIDWSAHHGGRRRLRVPLPTYPFERKRYWLDPDPKSLAASDTPGRTAPAETSAALVKKPDPGDWLYRPVWREAPLVGEAELGEATWLLFGDPLGVADALAERLRARGARVALAEPGDAYAAPSERGGRYRLRPGQPDDYRALLADLGGRPARVAHLWNLDRAPAGAVGEEAFRAAQEVGFYSLIALTKALAAAGRGGVRIDVVTSGVERVSGGEALVPERSTVLGACVVIGQEHPNFVCRAVDLELSGDADPAATELAALLERELAGSGEEPLVAWRDGERRARVFERAEMPPPEAAYEFRKGGVYLVTGGLGGIGLVLADHLASAGARLVLTRRTPLPERGEWDAWLEEKDADDPTRRAIARVQELEAKGAEVLVASADVADEEAMRAVLAEARERFGPLTGVVHAAGVLAEDSFKTVVQTGREECELHFHPKVYGLYALERVLADEDELELVTLYSSLSAILGGLGYVGYATANLFMDYFAERHNALHPEGPEWRSVDWDSWHYVDDEEGRGGLGTTLSELAMTPSEGVETLRRLLAVPDPGRLVVSTGELQPRIDQWVQLRTLRAEPETAGATRARRKAAAAPAGEELEAQIAGIWSRVLGVESIGREENFFDLGGNSLLGMQLVAELGRDLGVEVEPVALFESPTVRSMARYLSPEPEAPAEETRPSRRRRSGSTDVAIIGMDGRFPGADSVAEFWENLAAGRETITFFTDDELRQAGVDEKTLADPHYVKARPILDGVEYFDAPFFGYTPREAEIMDPQHRIFLESAWAAFEDAGYDVESYDGRVGVYAGASISSYMANIYSHPELVESVGTFQTLIGNEKDSLTTKVSYKLNLRGPSLAVQTFCSTSLVATHLAYQALLNDECDMALAGGVSVIVPQKSGYRFEEGGIGSVDGHIRAFDAKGSGIVFGNGLGAVVLKRLDDAIADGDPIRAVIKGSAINNDGSGKAGYSATSVEGQSEVVRAALELAEVDPETIGYMEAHGTGTPLGDPIEMAAINKAFRGWTERRRFCPIGSAKTNVGHLDRAAGITGLIKAVLTLEKGLIPPSLHFEDPNPAIDFESSSFWVVTEPTPWPRGETPRRAGVNSLGLGGTNAHVVLEEAPSRPPSDEGKPWQLLLVSAESDEALERATDRLAEHLRRHPEESLADVAYTLQIGRKAMSRRRALAVRNGDPAAAAEILAERRPQRVVTGVAAPEPPRVVFLFPGLGGQHSGMARGLYESEPVFRRELDRCAEGLEPHLGLDLREVLFPEGDQAEDEDASESPQLDLRRMLGRGGGDAGAGPLRRTAVAQPALFAVEYALARLWMSWGLEPAAMIGYSLGEYAAATVAGMMSLDDALRVVAERARMIEELPEGAMLAVPLGEDEVTQRLGEELSLAAVNGPQQSVVAGPVAAVEAFAETLAGEGVACRRLETTHAFHSHMMEGLQEPFSEILEGVELRPPRIPLLSNVTGAWMGDDEAGDRGYWARHMVSPVRFGDAVEALLGDGDRVLLELGPGQTLGSLVLQHPACGERKPPVVSALRHVYEKGADEAQLLTAAGRLWTAGVRLDWPALHDGERRLRVALPTYPFDRHRYWVEATVHGYAQVAAVRTGAADAAEGALLYLPSWRRSQTPRVGDETAPAPELERWLVFAEGAEDGLGAALARRLRAAGRQVTVAVPGDAHAELGDGVVTLRPEAPEDFEALFKDGTPDAAVHLWSLVDPEGGADLDRVRLLALDSQLRLARALAPRLGERERPFALWSVTAGAHEVSGEEGLRPGGALALAPARVLSREMPGIVCRSIDLTLPGPDGLERAASRVLAEVAAEAGEQLVAYRGRHRWLPTAEPAAGGDGGSLLRPEGAFLLTGGLNGRGFAFARFLAERVANARLALLEPREVTDGEGDAVRRRRLEALRERAAEVLVLVADLADREALRQAVGEARERLGALRGVVHAAEPEGRDAYLTVAETADDEKAAAGHALLDLRARGAEALAAAIAAGLDEPPEAAILVSSLASWVGGLGLVHDAAAGLYLDAYAAAGQNGHGPSGPTWTSVSWDFWLDDEDRVRSSGLAAGAPTAAPAAEGASCSALPLPGANGAGDPAAAFQAAALEKLFALLPGVPQVLATPRSLSAVWNRIETAEAESEPRAAEPGGLYPRPQLSTPYVAPRTDVERTLAEIWEAMLGVSQVGVQDGFLELGGDSLLAARLVARVRETFEIDLPVRVFFEAATVEQLAKEIEKRKGEDSDDALALLAEIEDLSEDELDRALAELESPSV